MRIKVNAIGLGEHKWLMACKRLIVGGGMVAAAGVASVLGGALLMLKSQEWTYGYDKDWYEYSGQIAAELHENDIEEAKKE